MKYVSLHKKHPAPIPMDDTLHMSSRNPNYRGVLQKTLGILKFKSQLSNVNWDEIYIYIY